MKLSPSVPLVRAEDAGRYSCKASNEVGEDWLHYELMVLSEWPAWGVGVGCRVCRPRERPPTPMSHSGEHGQSGRTWRLIM